MSRTSTSKIISSNVIQIDTYKIYSKPCKSCPSGIEPWIKQFCNNNPWYVPIDSEWAGDWFNQYGIESQFEDFKSAIEMIIDNHSNSWSEFTDDKIQSLHQQALRIYGLLHARWICQPQGMRLMKEKYEKGLFGKCIRYGCHGTKLLPMGTTFLLRRHSTKLFCPQCYDIYRAPPQVVLDGAHFGPAFPHIFLSEYSDFDKSQDFRPFEILAFGFKIHRNPNLGFPVHDKNRYEEEIPE